MEQKQEPAEDIRVQLIVRLWKIAALMLFIANAPSSRPANYGFIISLAVLAVVAIGTFIVWKFDTASQEKQATNERQKHLQNIEERLANLETINNFERRLAEEALARHASSPTGQRTPEPHSETTTEAQRVAP